MLINGIELPDLQWQERFESFGVESSVRKTRGGKIWVWEAAVSGKPITLVGGDDFGWFTYDQFNQIKQLSETPNMTYSFEFNSITETIRFRNEDSPSVSGTWVKDVVEDPATTDYISNITIKLMVV